MKQLYPDIWQSKLEVPFGNVHAHAYLIQRDEGNVLIYNTSHEDELDHIQSLGGLEAQFLSHVDETGPSLELIRSRFDSKLYCHADEESAVAKTCVVDMLFTEEVETHHGIDVLHTPGHSIGSVTYLYRSPHGKSYLFTGDTLFRSHDDWQTFAIPSAGGNTGALIRSLQQYRKLSPDVVLWSASGGGKNAYAEPSKNEWDAIVDSVIEKLAK